MNNHQPWIGNKWTELFFILSPPFLSVLLVFLFPALFENANGIPDYWWVVLILLVDVAHVYSTLYRTYFDTVTFQQQRNKLLLIPFIAFVVAVLLYSFNAMYFWRVLAYVAVFHFIRQQYGFMRIYSRKENASILSRKVDAITIYAATLFPLSFWHLSPDRNFTWFVDGDFLQFDAGKKILAAFSILYCIILMCYMVKELMFIVRTRRFNLPRNAVIVGTVMSWYFGIVYFNGDMAFTFLNVISHGIPYMALIWLYGKKNYAVKRKQQNSFLRISFSRFGIVVFLGVIFLLAYIEEGLWDFTVWKEHQQVFIFFHFADIQFNNNLLSFIVPLLALPQITHYIIDGYIWRIKKDDLNWSK